MFLGSFCAIREADTDRFETLHQAVKRVKPTETVNPDTYWVGILPPDKLPSDVKEHTDILWIKARAVSSTSSLPAGETSNSCRKPS